MKLNKDFQLRTSFTYEPADWLKVTFSDSSDIGSFYKEPKKGLNYNYGVSF